MKRIKILIFGNYNPLVLSLISRLDREGHTIFTVTGQEKKNRLKPRGVFQEYNFSYNSASIEFIIDNVDADLAIFEGAIDRLVELENQPSKISDYLAAITNIVLCLKNSTVKQLIYISTLNIFSGNSEVLIDESTIPNPRKNIEKTILMGENVCRSYDRERNFKVNIVRVSEVYGSYNDEYLRGNICTEICQKILKDERITVFKGREHNLLYVDDVVDGIYKILNHAGRDFEIYHLAAEKDQVYTADELIDIFKTSMDYKEDVITTELDDYLINKEYDLSKIKALDFKEKYKIEERIKELCKVIKKSMRERNLLTTDKVSIFAKVFKTTSEIKNRIFPFLENLLFFIILSIVHYYTSDMAIHEAIDIYLLYVVIIGLIYGYEQSVFAVILSVAFKLYTSFTMGTSLSSEPDYYIYMWILQLFTVGILVGYLKEQYKIKYLDMKDENVYLDLQLASIKEINRNNEEIKDLYERRLLNYKDSFGRIYEIISELDMIEPQGVIFKSIRVIGKVMSTKDVSVYIYSGNSNFFRLMAGSSEKSKTLKSSLKVSEYSEMFNKLLDKKIYINNSLDPNYPIMAGGTYKEGNLQTIIMIWSLPFESNNLYQVNVFGIVCKLIERSLNIGYEYVASISRNYNKKNDNIIDRNSFNKVVELYQEGSKENIVDFFLLQVKINHEMEKEEFNEILKTCIRETDFIGEGQQDRMCILLANTNEEQSKLVVDRLKKSGIEIIEGEVIEC